MFKDFRKEHFSELINSFFYFLDSLFKYLHMVKVNAFHNNNDSIILVGDNPFSHYNGNKSNNNNNNLELNKNVNWYRIYIFFIGGRDSFVINDVNNCPYKKEWETLYRCQINSGKYTKDPFLLRSVAILNKIMTVACKRQHILFNKFKTNLSNSVDADNTVGHPSSGNADPSGIG